MNFSNVFNSLFRCILLIPSYEKLLSSFVYVVIYYVRAGITTLMSISDGWDPYFSCQKKEDTRSVKAEMDGEVFVYRQSRHFFHNTKYD